MNGAAYRHKEKNGNSGLSLSLLEGSIGGGVGLGAGGAKAKVDAKVDVVHTRIKFDDDVTVDARLGLNASTGAELGPAGASVSFLGFGISVGRKTGFSFPFVEFSLNF